MSVIDEHVDAGTVSAHSRVCSLSTIRCLYKYKSLLYTNSDLFFYFSRLPVECVNM